MLISFIIPCYNAQDTITEVIRQTSRWMDQNESAEYEFVLVNDGSKDDTWYVLRRLAESYPNIKAIDLASNFGQHNALMAGLRHGEGDIFVGMDDDLQTHPSQLPKLFGKLHEGYDVVYGKYTNKKHTLLQRLGSRFNHFTVRKLIGKPKDLEISSFWVARRYVRDEIIRYPYPYTNLQGLFLRTTNNITNVEIEHFARIAGSSGYTLKKMISLWSSCTTFSLLPLRLALVIGLLLLSGSAIWGIVLLCFLCTGHAVGTVPPLLAGMFFCTGILLAAIGIAGEYIGRIFLSINKTPQYVIREAVHCEGKKGEEYHQQITDTGSRERADRCDPVFKETRP